MTDATQHKSYLHIYVFSYNRGVFLRNCLLSLQRSVPEYRVTVMDDGSKDKETTRVLNEWKNKHEVIVIDDNTEEEGFGGLYSNMSRAFIHAKERRFRYVLFIQDDMQFVRRMRTLDLQRADQFFDANKNSFELQTTFLKERFHVWDKDRMSLDSSGQAYIRKKMGRKIGSRGYSDVGLFDVDRFFDLFGELESDEVANEIKARERGICLGYYIYPFMMWLPYPISHWGKKRTIYLRAVERIAGAGFHPIRYMSSEDEREFLNRPAEELPVAERFLSAPTCPHPRAWATEGGLDALPPRGGWRNLLAKLLRRIERVSRNVQKSVNRSSDDLI